MIFKKYEFTDKKWETIRPTLYNKDEEGNETLIASINAVVEIGHICRAWSEGEEPECTDLSTKYSVDMLLNEEVESLEDYEVYPDPIGVHTFAGDDSLYLKAYCIKYPESEYCVIPESDEDLAE
jgi:hypothetical protein